MPSRTQPAQEPEKSSWRIDEGLARWWSDEGWERHLPEGVTANDVRNAIASLRPIFTAEWLAQLDHENVVAAQLVGVRGTSGTSFLLWLAKLIESFRSAEGFGRVQRALLGHKSEPTLYELGIAYLLHLHGFALSFPREQETRSHDLLAVRDGLSLAVECKWLQKEDWETWESDLMDGIFRKKHDDQAQQRFSIDLYLNPRLSQMRVGGQAGEHLNEIMLEALVEEISRRVNEACAQAPGPCQVSLGDFGDVELLEPSMYGGGLQSINGMERSAPALLRRLLQNGLLPAANQLPLEGPGLIAIGAPALPSQDFTDGLIDALFMRSKERLGHVVAILLCPRQTIFHHPAPRLCINRHSSHGRSEDWKRLLEAVFGPL